MVRLPPRRLRGLPRDRAGRGRADRALGARARRDGRARAVAAAFVALFVSANVSGLLVVAAFASTPWGFDRLHDRYGFYLVPLWLVGLVVWLAAGLPRPLRGVRDRSRRARCVLPLVLPVRAAGERGGDRHRPGRALGADRGGARRARARLRPARARALRRRRCSRRRSSCRGGSRGRRPAARRGGHVRRDVVLRVAAHDRGARGPRLRGRPRARLDRRARRRRRVGDEALRRHDLRLGARAARALPHGVLQRDASTAPPTSTGSIPDGLPIDRVDVATSGVLELAPGDPLRAEYVFTQPGHRARGPARRRGNGRRPRALAGRRPGARRRGDVERAAAPARLPA